MDNDMNMNEISSMCRECVDPQIEEQCILGLKVYGKCRQQDCLRPVDIDCEPPEDSIPIDPARNGEGNAISVLDSGGNPVETQPNQVIQLSDLVASVLVVKDSFAIDSIVILSIENSNFGPTDYWNVRIRYTFTYEIKLLDASGNPLPVDGVSNPDGETIIAYSTYEKEVSLCGGTGQEGVATASNFLAPQITYMNDGAPYAIVQAKADILDASIGRHSSTTCGSTTDTVECNVDVTIGLFTIIKLFRLVNMTVVSGGNCDVPVCETIVPGDPCSYFNSLPFPFDDFDPALCD